MLFFSLVNGVDLTYFKISSINVLPTDLMIQLCHSRVVPLGGFRFVAAKGKETLMKGVWHCYATASYFKMAAHRKFNDLSKSLGENYIYGIILLDSCGSL